MKLKVLSFLFALAIFAIPSIGSAAEVNFTYNSTNNWWATDYATESKVGYTARVWKSGSTAYHRSWVGNPQSSGSDKFRTMIGWDSRYLGNPQVKNVSGYTGVDEVVFKNITGDQWRLSITYKLLNSGQFAMSDTEFPIKSTPFSWDDFVYSGKSYQSGSGLIDPSSLYAFNPFSVHVYAKPFTFN